METENNKSQNPEEVQQAPATKVNKKAIVTVAAIVIAVVIIGLVWYLINLSGNKKADEAIALADIEMNDSIRLARYMDAATLGYKSGNRAKLEAAIALYNKGQYEGALKYLNDATIKSEIIDAGKYALMGDCYVNLGADAEGDAQTAKYKEALSCYKKAVDAADNNPQIVPFVLVKEANIYRALGNYDDEYKAYKTIYEKYPAYANAMGADIQKYIERARIAAGK